MRINRSALFCQLNYEIKILIFNNDYVEFTIFNMASIAQC